MSLMKLLKASQNRDASEASRASGASSPTTTAVDAASEQGESLVPPARGFGGRKMSVWSTVARKLSVSTTASSKAPVKPTITLPKKRFENSYRLEPETTTKFNVPKVEKFLSELLEMRLKSETYDAKTCSSLTTSLADVIKGRMKKMGFPRHRIVVYVVVGEKKDQGFQACGRSVWDDSADNFVYVTYENASLFVVANVYGVYYE
ncbi:dynein light chain Tctex-type 5-B-like [Asterias amurensis]|uniref:dynein light chain Tctex-type 5-B-like n=1 Tax=Asterias amurensis TaxID=7602 RepID=UPI003AB41CC1